MIQTEYFGLYVQATPPAPTLTGSELVPVVIAGVTNNTTTAKIAALSGAASFFVDVAGVGHPANVILSAGVTPLSIWSVPTPATGHNPFVTTSISFVPAAIAGGDIVTIEISYTDPIAGPLTLTIVPNGAIAAKLLTGNNLFADITLCAVAGSPFVVQANSTVGGSTVTYNTQFSSLPS